MRIATSKVLFVRVIVLSVLWLVTLIGFILGLYVIKDPWITWPSIAVCWVISIFFGWSYGELQISRKTINTL